MLRTPVKWALLALVAAVVGALTATVDAQPLPAATAGPDIQPAVLEALQEQSETPVIVMLRRPSPAGSASVSTLMEEGAPLVDGALSTLGPGDFSLTYQWDALAGFAGKLTPTGLSKLEANPDVEAVVLDEAQPLALNQSRALINADDALAMGFDGSGVVVAVLDTGIDTDHPDLAGSIVAEECFLATSVANGGSPCVGGGPTQTGPGAAEDDQGHGTSVSGIITGDGTVSPIGVAPNAGIIAYKVCNNNGDCYDSDNIAALNDLLVNKLGSFNVRSANMSLGGGTNAAACDGANVARTAAITALRAAGVLTFISSGNNTSKTGIGEPACISTAVSVGAVYDSNVGSVSYPGPPPCTDATTAADQVVCHSQSAPILDLLAPGGCCITTTAMGGGTNPGFGGTSAAAPHAAAVGALVAQANPSLSPDDIESTLKLTGVPVTDAANGITTPRVDVLAAILAVAKADLEVFKSDSPDPVMAGNQLYYSVTVVNNGPSPAGAEVTDTLPAGVTFVTDDLGVCTEAPAGTLTCPLGAVTPGASVTLTIKVEVDSDLVANAGGPTSICNIVNATSDVPDPDLINNSTSECTIVEELADLRITKVNKPDDEVKAGETVTYTILVDNLGPSVARNVQLTDVMLSNGVFTLEDVTTDRGTCTPAPWQLPQSASLVAVIICDLEDIEPASPSVSGRATVTVEVKALEAQDINNVADVISDTPDPDTSNNRAQASVSVTAVADLEISKSGNPHPTVIAGETLTYTIDVTSHGPSTAVNVVVEDVVPAGVSINSVSATGGGSCNAGVPGDPFLPTICTFDSLADGDSETMTIVVTVLPDTLGIIHNDARVDSETVDMNNSNNLATVATQVDDEADLEVAKADFPDPVVAGEPLTYEVSITNNGPSLARDVELTDTLPDEVSLTGTTISNGEGTCVLLEVPPNTVSCQLNDLDPGASVLVYIAVLVDPSVPDGTTISDSATASTSATDLVPANNSDTEDTYVEAVADLEIQKDGNFEANNPSSTIIYTVTVINHGPSDAQDVMVVDTLPADPKKARYVFDTGNGACTYDSMAHTVTCDFGTLPAGGTISVDILIEPKGSLGVITNTAVVSTTTTDPDSSNDTAVKDMLVQGGSGKPGGPGGGRGR